MYHLFVEFAGVASREELIANSQTGSWLLSQRESVNLIGGYKNENKTIAIEFRSLLFNLAVEILVFFRDCKPGEIRNDFGSGHERGFKLCPEGQYSFAFHSLTCNLCPKNADCPGGSMIKVNQGYWRSDRSSFLKTVLKNRIL